MPSRLTVRLCVGVQAALVSPLLCLEYSVTSHCMPSLVPLHVPHNRVMHTPCMCLTVCLCVEVQAALVSQLLGDLLLRLLQAAHRVNQPIADCSWYCGSYAAWHYPKWQGTTKACQRMPAQRLTVCLCVEVQAVLVPPHVPHNRVAS
jgi:hypothetical protein